MILLRIMHDVPTADRSAEPAPRHAARQNPRASRAPRIFYAAGPGDVIETYRHWKSDEHDPSQVHLTYSGQFYDLCRGLDADAFVMSSNPRRQKLVDGKFRFEDRPIPFA